MEVTLLIIVNQMGLKTEEQIAPYLEKHYIEKYTKDDQIYLFKESKSCNLKLLLSDVLTSPTIEESNLLNEYIYCLFKST